MLWLVLGCFGSKDDGPSNTGDSAGDSADLGSHPNVPPEFDGLWQVDGCEDGTATVAYILAEGHSEADGSFEMTETWYWFFDDPGWDDDCIDEMRYTGDRVSRSVHESLSATEAEEGYMGSMKKTEDGCPGVNYLETWDHPDAKGFDYGDSWNVDFVVFFDTLSPSGNLNWENAMLTFMYLGEGNSMTWGSTSYAGGTFSPEDESVPGPPADYTYNTSICFNG
ncbi:MAG: hypothetical protein GY913_26560 [Proteobacteria bacterium]|nr:hypothetical protein [Pseudomonadota bacterium]MCP4920480.1 hypothetical protein [Pseudomonadota bacterium]